MDPAQITDVVASTVADCLKRFTVLGLSADKVDIRFYNDADTPHCLFVQPNRLAVNLLKCSDLSSITLRSHVIDAMTSCATHRQYMRQSGKMNSAVVKAVTPRPSRIVYGSPKWIHMRLLLTRDSS